MKAIAWNCAFVNVSQGEPGEGVKGDKGDAGDKGLPGLRVNISYSVSLRLHIRVRVNSEFRNLIQFNPSFEILIWIGHTPQEAELELNLS